MESQSCAHIDFHCRKQRIEHYLPVNGDGTPKSPVEFHRLPRPPLPLLAFTDCGRGDGDGAGDIELLLGESEWIDPFDWCIDFVRLWCKLALILFTDWLWRLECNSTLFGLGRPSGLRNFQSLLAELMVDAELLCVGLCEVTANEQFNFYMCRMRSIGSTYIYWSSVFRCGTACSVHCGHHVNLTSYYY